MFGILGSSALYCPNKKSVPRCFPCLTGNWCLTVPIILEMSTLLGSYKSWRFNWKARHRSLIRVLLIPSPQPGPAWPGLRTQEKLSNLGVWGSAAPQNTNYKHSALDWCVRGGQGRSLGFSSGWHWFQKIWEEIWEVDWKTMGFIERLNCKMLTGKTNLIFLFVKMQ